MNVLWFFMGFVLFGVAVVLLRRHGFIRGRAYVYNFSIILIYLVAVFFVIPNSGDLISSLYGHGVRNFVVVNELEFDLTAWRVEQEKKVAILGVHVFTLYWFIFSSVVMAGLAMGFGKEEEQGFSRQSELGKVGWGLLTLGSISVAIVLFILILPDFLSSPMEDVGARCRRGCSGLIHGLFPYYAGKALHLFGWNIVLYVFISLFAYKIRKGV